MSVRFNIRGYIDRRSPALLSAESAMRQKKADKDLERLWRAKVAANPIEQQRVLRELLAGF